jgi:hypothetical protein
MESEQATGSSGGGRAAAAPCTGRRGPRAAWGLGDRAVRWKHGGGPAGKKASKMPSLHKRTGADRRAPRTSRTPSWAGQGRELALRRQAEKKSTRAAPEQSDRPVRMPLGRHPAAREAGIVTARRSFSLPLTPRNLWITGRGPGEPGWSQRGCGGLLSPALNTPPRLLWRPLNNSLAARHPSTLIHRRPNLIHRPSTDRKSVSSNGLGVGPGQGSQIGSPMKKMKKISILMGPIPELAVAARSP